MCDRRKERECGGGWEEEVFGTRWESEHPMVFVVDLTNGSLGLQGLMP